MARRGPAVLDARPHDPPAATCRAARSCSAPTPSASSAGSRTSWWRRSAPRSRRSRDADLLVHVVDGAAADADAADRRRARGAARDRRRRRARAARGEQDRHGRSRRRRRPARGQRGRSRGVGPHRRRRREAPGRHRRTPARADAVSSCWCRTTAATCSRRSTVTARCWWRCTPTTARACAARLGDVRARAVRRLRHRMSTGSLRA